MTVASMPVPIIRIPYGQDERDFLHAGIEQILDSGQLTASGFTRQFEQDFAAFTGSRFAVAVTNATTGLEVILRALRIENASVVVPTNTFLATAFAVLHSGNRVIFADCDPSTLCLTAADVERRIEPDTKAVILVHIGGVITPEVDALRQVCERRGLYLIEDCAHAHGSTIDGRQAGTLGIAGAFSFFPTKVLTTGEGGMISTDDEQVAQRAGMIRNHGKNPALKNRMSEVGHNFRMSEFTALLGVAQMRKASQVVEERRAIAAFYDHALAGVPGVRPLSLPKNVQSTYYKYIAYLDEGCDRAAVKRIMKDEYGVSLTGEVYEDLCHTEPVWEQFTGCGRQRSLGPLCQHAAGCNCERPQAGDFPGSEYVAKHHICLPLYPGLTPAEQEHVVESLDRTLRRLGGR